MKNCSCQRTTKGVNNVLMQAFLFKRLIGGGRLSTMVWTVPNFGKGGSLGFWFLLVLVQILCLVHLFFCLMRPIVLPGIFKSGKKIDLDPY